MIPNTLADRIRVFRGDITSLAFDAIVNAANEAMLGGGGVDGAIHRAAGPDLLAECRTVGGCPTGEARITKGYRLPAKFIIHTVGPVWTDGSRREPELLKSCYRNSLQLAESHKLKTIAFPCISTGVYGYPLGEACQIAVTTAVEWLTTHELPTVVTFCCFSREDQARYEKECAVA
ncbi:MAG: O-acetyl-ADP-ribose deacetylase [Planctomycetes bacterium]|nr:O-acetyl-ADP-ribose deacetylase [Planctomycetota bacterium]